MSTVWKAFWSEDKDDREKLMSEARGYIKALENELRNKKFFGGDHAGLVDIVANFIALWLGAFEEVLGLESNLLTEDKFPNLCKWRDEYVNCNVIKNGLPPRDKLVAGLRARFGASK